MTYIVIQKCLVAGPALPPGYKENSKYFDSGEKYVSAQMRKETDLDSEEDKDPSPVPRLVNWLESLESF